MRKTKLAMLLLVCEIIVSVITSSAQAQPDMRHGITLLRTTRFDLEAKYPNSDQRAVGTYVLPDGILLVDFYEFDRCKPSYGLKPTWDVPKWAVEEYTFIPTTPPMFNDFHLDPIHFRTERESPHVPDLISYINDIEGVDYTFNPDGTLNQVRYFPGTRSGNHRCPQGD
jgi:hypothetical protein